MSTTISDLAAAARRHWRAFVIAAVMLATQFTVQIPNPVSTSGSKTFNVAELPLLIGAGCVVWWLVRRPWSSWSRLARWLIVATPVAVVAWAGMVVLRKLVTGASPVQITPIEFLVLGVVAFLVVERTRTSTLDVTLGTLGFLLTANLYSLLRLAQGVTVRNQSLLGNTNLYVGAVLMILPTLFLLAVRTSHRVLRWVILVTAAHTMALVVLSGSRFGGVASLTMLLLTFAVVDPRPWKDKIKAFLVFSLLTAVIFGGAVASNRKQLRDVERTFNIGSVISGEEPDTEDIVKEDEQRRRDGTKVEQKMTDQDRFTTPGDPDHDAPPPPPQLNIFNHSRVADRSTAVLKDHWLLGIGRIGPYFSGYGYQPAHNIAMEIVLYMGALGAPFFFAVLLAAPFGARRRGDRRAWLLGFAGLFSFAMFQPLLSDALVTILPLWLTLGGVRKMPTLSRGASEAPLP